MNCKCYDMKLELGVPFKVLYTVFCTRGSALHFFHLFESSFISRQSFSVVTDNEAKLHTLEVMSPLYGC